MGRQDRQPGLTGLRMRRVMEAHERMDSTNERFKYLVADLTAILDRVPDAV